MYTLVPYINHDWLHGGSAGNFDCLVLVHSMVGPFIWGVVAEAWSILNIYSEEWSEVIEIWPNDAGATVAVALSMQTELAHVTSGRPIRMHDLLVSNIVSNKIKAASNHMNCLNLFIKAIHCVVEVHISNYWFQFESHLDKFAFLSETLGSEDKWVFQNDVTFDIKTKLMGLIQLQCFWYRNYKRSISFTL